MPTPETQRILLTKEEVKKLLGIGDATFSELGVDYIQLGRRRRYVIEDVYRAINERKQPGACHLPKGRIRRSGGTTSPSTGIGFEEALKRAT